MMSFRVSTMAVIQKNSYVCGCIWFKWVSGVQGRSTHFGRSGHGQTVFLLHIDLRMRKLRWTLFAKLMSDERILDW